MGLADLDNVNAFAPSVLLSAGSALIFAACIPEKRRFNAPLGRGLAAVVGLTLISLELSRVF
jgi:hypothetical protein